MKIFRYLLFMALSLLLFSKSYAQPAIGEWTDYQSYANAKNVVDTGDKIYCVTEGGLFSYNKTDNSVQKMSGINGLSDAGIQRLAYNKEKGIVLIAYQNANIDLLIGNDIFNLSDIKRKQISADKTINNIMFSGNLAYLSCGFGIVVINIDRKEIKDTYFIGKDGGYLNVLDMATDGIHIYAATGNGVYKALAAEPNLQNYNNWVKQQNIPHPDGKFSKIEFFKGKVIANYTTPDDQWSGDELYELSGNSWIRFLPEIRYASDITSNGSYIVFSSREEVFVYNDKMEKVKYVNKYSFQDGEETSIRTRCAELDAQNILWIADQKHGLIKLGTAAERIVPEGPADNAIFSLSMNGQDLWVASGGRDNAWDNMWIEPKFQLNREGDWTLFDSKTFTVTNGFKDIVCVAADPKNPDHVFAGSWGGGVLEFNAGKFVKRFDNFNSTLQTAIPGQPDAPYVRIGGMDFDSKGNLWVTNSEVGKNLSVYQTDGTWKAYELSGIANKYSIGKVVVTQDDDKWILVPRGKGQSLYVLNSTNTAQKEQQVVARFVNSEGEFFTEMSNVLSMVEDKNGEIWVGTTTGVAVFSNPKKVWTESVLYATRPGLDLKDNIFHPLLQTETVTAIAVDGANRKWFGTKTSGVFLISEDGEKELEHFTTENSPLLSNEITDIAVNEQTGEVFFGTAAGLISVMGEATAPNDEFSDVYVYPNPVRETHDGPIVVKGLVDDTDVKITDISGNLVYKTTSLGGQAIWDGKNLNGNRCKTGVYLIFMTDPAGEKTKITKLLFIH
ncbi:MAG: T9SS type A sorting domain-containing protein [Prolixibacteraceae bacterium]|nr:T9SS type A sorting domain-containing protein [Prolixibacteraceae bacterium]